MPSGSAITHPSQQSLDVVKAIKLRFGHKLSFQQIADILKVHVSAVHQRLSMITEFIRDPELVAGYREHKADFAEVAELKLMASLMDDEALAKASINNRAYALKQVHEIGRLERGQSTQNVGVLSKMIVQSRAELFVGKSRSPKQVEKDSESALSQDATELIDP